MRQVGDPIEGRDRAERLVRFLASQKIAAEAREDDGEKYKIWILDEDYVPMAEAHYSMFASAPDDKRFDVGGRPAATAAAGPSHATPRRKVAFGTHKHRWDFGGFGAVTLSFIVLSIIATVMRETVDFRGLTHWLYYAESYNFEEIRNGQVWRIITPIFLHGGWLHLIMNMMWLVQLGNAIETLEGSPYLLGMMLLFAAGCDTAQYLVSGPAFVGMSGVVYGLLGYIWMMSKYQAGTAYALNQQTVVMMLVWMGICIVGLIPNVANTQHVVGLLLGMAWGFVRSGGVRTWRRRQSFKRKL